MYALQAEMSNTCMRDRWPGPSLSNFGQSRHPESDRIQRLTKCTLRNNLGRLKVRGASGSCEWHDVETQQRRPSVLKHRQAESVDFTSACSPAASLRRCQSKAAGLTGQNLIMGGRHTSEPRPIGQKSCHRAANRSPRDKPWNRTPQRAPTEGCHTGGIEIFQRG
jgi:hypothetical protein